jgi:hypothetical protein
LGNDEKHYLEDPCIGYISMRRITKLMRNGLRRCEIESGSRQKKPQWQTSVMTENIQVPL